MKKLNTTFIWILAVLITLFAAYFQRVSGPTYPVSGKVTINNSDIKYKLSRSATNTTDAPLKIIVPDTSISGKIIFKRFKSHDTLQTQQMMRVGDTLIFNLPKQPAAGKIMYQIALTHNDKDYVLSTKDNDFTVLRFKGSVPAWVLIPHIIIMFTAMLLSTRTGLEAVFRRKNTYKLSIYTLIFLLIGGFVFGAILQKYAFGVYWSGIPFGKDLTDNKTLIAIIIWVWAVVKLRRNPENRVLPIVAALVIITIYLIPHSLLGSEIDFTQMNQ